MKKKYINKIIAFTLCLVALSATLVSAKEPTKDASYECYYSDYLPDDPDEPRS